MRDYIHVVDLIGVYIAALSVLHKNQTGDFKWINLH